MRTHHPGADQLSFLGNLLWYVRQALPFAIGWPALIFAAIGLQPDGDIVDKIKGRRVFIGSTATSLNDYQNTLFGRTAGLHLLGQVNQLAIRS